MSASDAAELVAAEYFAGGSGRGDDKDFDELFTPLVLDASKGHGAEFDKSTGTENERTTHADETEAATYSEEESNEPSSLEDDALALEVGLSAHEYLEECFYTEISVLDRKKFNDIPEIIKSDFTITGHLGKGSYSDVFEVVFKRNDHPGVTKTTTINTSRRPARARRATSALSSSVTATLSRQHAAQGTNEGRRTLAMKCLRPQIRSDADQFMIGAEDLVHETAILANLSHPNIIKLHGRASGHLTDAFVLNDGYFILLDRLTETLHDRIEGWKADLDCLHGPTMNQIEVAQTVANAMSYLHAKKILFRDLKPANVGFDSMGVLKLFDFGFAVGLPEKSEHNPRGLLYDRCGTPRYMAPEVGLSRGYNIPADVYSFGILLWEMCSLGKPFGHINSASEFDQSVFVQGERPFVDSNWPLPVKELMNRCWDANPRRRPTMVAVKSTLTKVMESSGTEDTASSTKVLQARRGRTTDRPRTRRLSVIGW
jgi:serine/threonine protein kinase